MSRISFFLRRRLKRAIPLLLVAAGFVGISRGQPAPVESGTSPEAQLSSFLGDEEQSQLLAALITQLGADSFAERETAFAKLSALPSLPAHVRRLARTHDQPEVRARLSKIAKLLPVEEETARLNAIFKRIADEKIAGTLGTVAGIVEAEVWSTDRAILERAARVTVTKADLPLLEKLLASPSAAIRRLAAAAYGGLPDAQSTAPLGKLLDDKDESVVLIAAAELARRKVAACLPAFARLLDSPDFYTRHRSWSALKGLSGKAFGFDPSAKDDARRAAARSWQKWSRAPDAEIVGEIPESSAIALFNGRDLSGWNVFENAQPAVNQTSWEARDGSLVSVGNGFGDIRTTRAYENYVLTLQYRIEGASGDGGVGVMLTAENENIGAGPRGDAGKYLEVQILPRRAGDLYLIGGFKAHANGKAITFSSRRTAEVDDPAGQWHQLKLSVKDGDVEVEINGTVVNRATQGSKGPGKIVLRNEGDKISYKEMLIHPVDP